MGVNTPLFNNAQVVRTDNYIYQSKPFFISHFMGVNRTLSNISRVVQNALMGQTRASAAHKMRKTTKSAICKIIKIILIVFLSILMGQTRASAAHNVISGKVVDNYGKPIVGATIATNLSSVGTLTNKNGLFELGDNKDIKYITVSSVGFKAVNFSVSKIPQEIILENVFYNMGDILVTSDRAELGVTPIAFDNFSAQEIERDYGVGEFTLLLKTTPNLHTFVDAGSSLGFGSVRIRGFDDKRIMTYINGVPLNDPEDQLTYFVDLPDFASNISDIQVQRGIGNSLYGDASFGGTINIVTDLFSAPQKTTLSMGYGEYLASGNSIGAIYKQNIEYSSGLVNGRWIYGGRLSKQKSDGYRHSSWYQGSSYYFTIGRIDKNMTTELMMYGGPVKYHAAWYGSSRDELAIDRRVNVGIPGYDELTYANATDNFSQPHFHLTNRYKLNDKTTIQNTLYYIRGKGFFEQYKPFQNYADYSIDTSVSSQSSGDLVRQLWVEKNQIGWSPSVIIEHDKGKHTFGGSFYYFNSEHYGKVVWAQNIDGLLDPTHKYHTYYGTKYVGSLYGQENYQLTDKLSTLATAQLRFQQYEFNREQIGPFLPYNYTIDYLFLSPRIGLYYTSSEQLKFYGSASMASRTPTDKAIFDGDNPSPGKLPNLEVKDSSLVNGVININFGEPTVKPERVTDLEFGMNFRTSKIAIDANIYWMNFKNMIVAEGGVTDGIKNSVNINRVVHSGLELSATYKLSNVFQLSGNAAYNHNRIKDFVQLFEYSFDTTDGGGNPVTIDESTSIDFSGKKVSRFPEILGNIIADYNSGNFRFTYYGNYIGRQYSDLQNIESLSIEPVFVSSVATEIHLGKIQAFGDFSLNVRIDNLFSKKYESAVAYAENYAFRSQNRSAEVGGWSTYYVASELSFFTQIKMELF